jgi:hypothetical protein
VELKQAVLFCVRERILLLDAYLGDDEDPERWACDALKERLRELFEAGGVEEGVTQASSSRVELLDVPDFGDGDELRRELFEVHQELTTADFVVDVCDVLDSLPVAD